MAKQSKAERLLGDQFKGSDIVYNDRKFIGKEIDLWFPKHNLAIEIDDPAWHTEFHGRDADYHKDKFNRLSAKYVSLLSIQSQDVLERLDLVTSIVNRELERDFTINVKLCRPTKCSLEDMREFCYSNSLTCPNLSKLALVGLDDRKGLACVIYLAYQEMFGQKTLVIHGIVYRPGVYVGQGFSKIVSDIAKSYDLSKIHYIHTNGMGSRHLKEILSNKSYVSAKLEPNFKWVKAGKVVNRTSLSDSVGYARMFDYGCTVVTHTNQTGKLHSLDLDLPFVETTELNPQNT